ncbi:MAG TPA: choice-of-anchor tandem repeat GloVer-containing protein [Candidatus Cybelea sp.]
MALSLAGCGGSLRLAPQFGVSPQSSTEAIRAPATETVLWSFKGSPSDGGGPTAGLIADAGNLYGTTPFDGQKAPHFGTVYKIVPNGSASTETLLHTFAGLDGSYPYAPLVSDAKGNLYGTTDAGGSTYGSGCNTNGCGSVFELMNASGHRSESVLYSFKSGTDGSQPFGPVTFDGNGNLFGTTQDGGKASCAQGYQGCGTVFELSPSPSGWKRTPIHAFGGVDGALPATRVMIDSQGNIFGTTPKGGGGCSGAGCGVVFELSGSGSSWSEKILHQFAGGSDGGAPSSGMIADTKGNLYGATASGGKSGLGLVYELTRASKWKERVLFNFSSATAAKSPSGELAFDAHGNLLGVSAGGNVCIVGHQRPGCGVVYELSPAKNGPWKETDLFKFAQNNGGWFPNGGLIVNAGEIIGTAQRRGTGSGCCGVAFELAR